MKIIHTILMSLMLVGCAAEKQIIRVPFEVEVPVIVECPAPPTINPPFLPIYLLSEEDKGDNPKIARAYVESLQLMKNYAEKQSAALGVYSVQ